ncbi:MAG: sucrase ferredoxin [Cyanobacteria bacterium J06641_5]
MSLANQEDPIGTAGTVDHWLVFEMPQPWTERMFREDPILKSLVELLKKLAFKHGLAVRPILIASDREYSSPETTRALYYYRPQRLFSQFLKREFLVPSSHFPDFARAILGSLVEKSSQLDKFLPFERDTQHVREILVCTHGNIDVACARFGFPIYKQLRSKYADRSEGQLRVWRCSHFGGHQFAPTLIDLPNGHYWGHIEPKLLDSLIYRQGNVEQLQMHFRGWAGLNKFEQIAERELWMKYGWVWLSWNRAGSTHRKGLRGLKAYLYRWLRLLPSRRVQLFLEQWTKDATWAKVQIEVERPGRSEVEVHKIRVEQKGEVVTAFKSPKRGEKIELHSAPQYRVIHMEK